MSSAFPRLAAAVFPLALLALPCAASESEDEAPAVERLERELVEAIAKTDLAAYDRIVADDYVVFDESGKQITKPEIIASYRSGARRYTGLEIFDVHGRVFGDTAVVSARTRGSRREGDRDVPNNVRYIRIYARRQGRWRAVAQMSAALAQPAQAAAVPAAPAGANPFFAASTLPFQAPAFDRGRDPSVEPQTPPKTKGGMP